MTRILYVTPEAQPLIKTGGLADVSGALPAALNRIGHDCRILLPGYTSVMENLRIERKRPAAVLHSFLGQTLVYHGISPGTGTQVYVIDNPKLYKRDGGPYVDQKGNDWKDNHTRFALLSQVAATLCGDHSPMDWQPEILHANDWQTGLASVYLRLGASHAVKTVFTIHNIGYQGNFPPNILPSLHLPMDLYTPEHIEFYGKVSFLKAGIIHSDHVTTVSPTYANEIQTPELGFGMDGVLRSRSMAFTGILNGIDVYTWNPAADTNLRIHYDRDRLQAKDLNKVALQQEMGLEQDETRPLLAAISRLSSQKGLDLVPPLIPSLIDRGCQFVLLGTGDSQMEDAFRKTANTNRKQIAVRIDYDEGLAHRIEAGADMFLMPSRYEPCGLNQMYSMRYGTIPIARRTGGLADTIVDTTTKTPHDQTATGFLFDDISSEALLKCINNALKRYRQTKVWQNLQLNGMKRSFGWEYSAAEYAKLYKNLINNNKRLDKT